VRGFRFGRGAKSGLGKQTADALNAGQEASPSGEDIAALVASMGKTALAERMAGTSDKKSTRYRNARDSINRYLRGVRNPNVKAKQKLANIAEQHAKKSRVDSLRDRRSLNVHYAADIRKSKKMWHGQVHATLEGADLQDYLDALESGHDDDAFAIALDAYGLDPMDVAEVRNVNGVTIY
jgi:hypothetical protein